MEIWDNFLAIENDSFLNTFVDEFRKSDLIGDEVEIELKILWDYDVFLSQVLVQINDFASPSPDQLF